MLKRLDQLTDAFGAFKQLANNLNGCGVRPGTTTGPATATTGQAPTQPAASGGLEGTLQKLDRALDGSTPSSPDAQNQQNIKVTLEKISARPPSRPARPWTS